MALHEQQDMSGDELLKAAWSFYSKNDYTSAINILDYLVKSNSEYSEEIKLRAQLLEDLIPLDASQQFQLWGRE